MGQLTRNEVFTLAVQKYSDAVYRAAIHNSRCTADAEDVVQAVFLKLYEKPPAWLCDKAERDSGRAMAAEAAPSA